MTTRTLALLFLLAPVAAASAPEPASRIAGEVGARELSAAIGSHKGRVVLLNFWATWCVPCREEFPSLVRLQRAYGPRLQVLGVSTDFARERPGVEKFLAEQKPNFPNYHKRAGDDDEDFIEAVDPRWGGELPFSVIYGRDGRKIRALSGQQSYADFEREVRKLLR